MLLDLDIVKKHLNIDPDFCDDDDYIVTLAEVAEQAVEKHIDSRLSDIAKEEDGLPSPLFHAMLLMIGNLYANRESVSYSTAVEVPKSYDYLLSLYRNYNWKKD